MKTSLFKYSLLTACILSCHQAMAESKESELEKESEVLEEVVAVGQIFEGEQKALDTQRTSNRILNAISADGIGKLPDRNAAEAVQRVPGVSIERDQGEGRFVAIRGLPSQWSSTTINGDRIPTAEEETTSRATAFDFFPTEMIESVEVSKAITPDMEGDAIGGNVNFITRRAAKDTLLDVTVGTNYNAKAGGFGRNVSVLGGGRAADDKLGYIISATSFVRDWATDNFEPRRSGDAIRRLELRDYFGERDTRGFNAATEYQFDNGDVVYAGTLYGTLIDEETHYKHRYRFDKDRIELQHIHNILTTELNAFHVGGEHTLTESGLLEWKLSTAENRFFYGDIPNSKDKSYFVVRFDQKDVGYTGLTTAENGKNYSYNPVDGGNSSPYRPSTHLPSGFQMDPSQMSLAYVELYKVDVREKDKAVLQVDFTKDINMDLQVKTGLKYRSKERSAIFADEFYVWDEENYGAAPTLADFDLRDQPGRSDFLDDIGADYAGDFGQVASMDDIESFWNANRDKFILDEAESALVSNGSALGRNFDVTETHMAAYGMATYHATPELTLVGGLRLEQTVTEVDGQVYIADDNSLEDNNNEKDYLSVLPSLHVTYALDEATNLRLALSRTFARPDFGSLTPGGSYLEVENEFTSGNPDLEPTYSTNIDVLYEHYFDTFGVISAGAFYKAISDPIFSNSSIGSYRGIEGVTLLRPENGEDAWLAGAEFAVTSRLDFIHDSLYDFGVQANYTRMRSVMELPDGRSAEIPRQANQLYNTTFFYDNDTFALRLAVNHKGDYIEDYGSDSDADSYYGKFTSVDISSSFQVSDELMVYADLNNLTNQPLLYYRGTKDRPLQKEYYGYRANIGLKYSFF